MKPSSEVKIFRLWQGADIPKDDPNIYHARFSENGVSYNGTGPTIPDALLALAYFWKDSLPRQTQMTSQEYRESLDYCVKYAGHYHDDWNIRYRRAMKDKGLVFNTKEWRDPAGLNRDITAPLSYGYRATWPDDFVIAPHPDRL